MGERRSKTDTIFGPVPLLQARLYFDQGQSPYGKDLLKDRHGLWKTVTQWDCIFIRASRRMGESRSKTDVAFGRESLKDRHCLWEAVTQWG